MSDPLVIVAIALSLIVGVYALIRAVRNLPLDDPLLYALGALEAIFVVQLVFGVVALIGTDRDVAGASFIGYLVACVVLPPIATLWALVERTRYGPTVIAVLGLTSAVLVVRLTQIWNPVV